MKERPILFNGPIVRAVLEGRKVQARRIVKPQPIWIGDPSVPFKTPDADPKGIVECPFGYRGDRLWVRETWRLPTGAPKGWVDYRADDSRGGFHWRPSIHMPRWASRITLEVTEARVERLQDISEEDAEREGVDFLRHIPDADETLTAKKLFMCLWESINGPGSWEVNPWVWVAEFKRVERAGKAEGREE